jgi:hypothetical protein
VVANRLISQQIILICILIGENLFEYSVNIWNCLWTLCLLCSESPTGTSGQLEILSQFNGYYDLLNITVKEQDNTWYKMQLGKNKRDRFIHAYLKFTYMEKGKDSNKVVNVSQIKLLIPITLFSVNDITVNLRSYCSQINSP